VGLHQRGLEHFDAWAATFGEVIDTMEISPDGVSMRPRSRFARFTNLPELQQMFRAFADVQTAEMLDLPRPRLETGKPIVVACPMSNEQRAIQQMPVERYERLWSQKVDPREDNALNITTDGRILAIDTGKTIGLSELLRRDRPRSGGLQKEARLRLWREEHHALVGAAEGPRARKAPPGDDATEASPGTDDEILAGHFHRRAGHDARRAGDLKLLLW
jgi:hypothetical protein